MITIAWMTNRKEPCVQWFLDSLHRECGGDYIDIKIVLVDFYADYPGRREEFSKLFHCPVTHIPPMPNVWQGPTRLTTQDYFAASNARNTALCVAPDGYIVYVDDLSVLLPGWLAEVRRAVAGGYVACGAYEKVLGLEVKDGDVVGFRDYPPGKDSRSKVVFTQDPVPCDGGWLFGCSVAIPVEALLQINGWNTDCDSMGFEDCICGIVLKRVGYKLFYCPRMKTLESEERHHIETPLKRIIKPAPNGKHGQEDASWRMLNMVQSPNCVRFANYCDYRQVRQQVLFDNQPFPVIRNPLHHWPDGQLLSEM